MAHLRRKFSMSLRAFYIERVMPEGRSSPLDPLSASYSVGGQRTLPVRDLHESFG